jgi:hypothetical protein
LSVLYDGCKAEIEKRGGEVNLRMPLRRLQLQNGAIESVEFGGGRKESAGAYVFAVPHQALLDVLPEEAKQLEPALAKIAGIGASPITGVHFWFDRKVMSEPFLTMMDTTTQWIFNKTALYGTNNASGEKGQYLQLVISASYDLLALDKLAIRDLVLDDQRLRNELCWFAFDS